MTLPREIIIIDGKLFQYPVHEIKNYRKNHVGYRKMKVIKTLSLDGIEGQSLELEIEIDSLNSNMFGLKILKGENQETVIYYNKSEGKITFNRSRSGEDLSLLENGIDDIRKVPIELKNNVLKMHIFIDRCSVEIFLQDGERVMTSTVYPKAASRMIEFITDTEVIIRNLDKWDIVK